MKIAIASLGWTLLLLAQDAGRVPIAPVSRSAPVLASLREAKEGLKAWRTAAEAGPGVDLADLKPIQQELMSLVEELEALHARALAQEHASAAALPARAEPTSAEALQTRHAHEIASGWIDDAHAIGEGARERREGALRAVREALRGGDPTGQLAALQTLSSIGDVEFDKQAFRSSILPYTQGGTGPLVPAALSALLATDPQPGDLALVHAAWQRAPDAMRDSALHLMRNFGGGKIEGRSEEIALELLAGRDPNTNVQFGGLWGAEVGPRLEERLLEIARGTDHEMRHAAIYFGLSTFMNKSQAVVDALIATLSDPDSNNSGRALWGLGQGVPAELHRHVAAALVDLHNERSDPKTRERCARLVKAYGGSDFEAQLKR